ncbi:leucine-rich repeat-containing G-protein coupled receptor 5-like protein [Lates japonicus]|uniref:Leucine-rich repeat-containing G-protein coupled receptor 5-like protein n=1 Tax=Lates japonicus TaxID=270547 RepID=A0AAD3M6H6_LATJO|nr:leucine-rich repeat-containing G-protein coupled receptor 5-like protein [Lates japonicus]
MGTNCFHGLHSLETLDLTTTVRWSFLQPSGLLSYLKELLIATTSSPSPEHAFTGNPLITKCSSLNGAADLTEFPDLTGTKRSKHLQPSKPPSTPFTQKSGMGWGDGASSRPLPVLRLPPVRGEVEEEVEVEEEGSCPGE